MAYSARTTCPENGNKFYNRKVNGGHSSCIQGNKNKACYNSKLDVLPNCVGYASGRFNEIIGSWKYAIPGNAEDWYANAKSLGLEVGNTPKLGAVAVWSVGKVRNGKDGAGHVAIVEKIISSNEIITSESGWNSTKLFWTQNRKKGSNANWGQSTTYKFLGFIYNPYVIEMPKGVTELKFSVNGNDVSAWSTNINDQNYIRIADLVAAGLAKSVNWNSIKNKVEINK